MGEFDLITQYFSQHKRLDRPDILQSVGDDCAVTAIEANQQLAITTDTLVCGTHFLENIAPAQLAQKTVAVNLSDLAAMGAKPTWVSLALTLPNVDHQWLAEFSRGLFEILQRYDVALIGGDTTKGHLSLTLTAQGVLTKDTGLFRHQAKVGDWIFVSGYLGDSAAGLDLLLNQAVVQNDHQRNLVERHLCPMPRIELGQLLTRFSRCAIDISDGLIADLGHILARSQCGAELWLEKLPLSHSLLAEYSQEQAEKFALTGGEDYELCFTIPAEQRDAFETAVKSLDIRCSCIGRITERSLTLLKKGEKVAMPSHIGFDHFNS